MMKLKLTFLACVIFFQGCAGGLTPKQEQGLRDFFENLPCALGEKCD
jgi:hypothetical protein